MNLSKQFQKGTMGKHVLQEEQVERHAYELCALSKLRSGLCSGDHLDELFGPELSFHRL